MLTENNQKLQNHKRGYYPPTHRLNVDVMLSDDFWSFWSVAVNIKDKRLSFMFVICCFIANFINFGREGYCVLAHQIQLKFSVFEILWFF